MSETPYHHGELRTALLDAAEALVREQGVAHWSLREASARVGVSPSAAYHHFASRDALVRALGERVLAELGARMSSAAAQVAGPDVDVQQRLVATGCAYVRWALEDPAVARLAFGSGARDPEAALSQHPHEVIEAELDRLVDTGALNATARPGAEFAVWAAIHGLATLLGDGLMILDGPEAADLQTERVLRAILTGLMQETAPLDKWPATYSPYTQRRVAHQGNGTADQSPASSPTLPKQ